MMRETLSLQEVRLPSVVVQPLDSHRSMAEMTEAFEDTSREAGEFRRHRPFLPDEAIAKMGADAEAKGFGQAETIFPPSRGISRTLLGTRSR